MKAVILNDTSNQLHHGCKTVMKVLKDLCGSTNTPILATNFVNTDWQRDHSFSKCLDECDLVLINGEGTIHHGAYWGKRLLEAGVYAKKRGKKVFLLNATWQDNPASFFDYATALDGIFVRESFSSSQLAQGGVNAEIVPDLTMFATRPTFNNRSGTLVTDSVNKDLSTSLFHASQNNNFEYGPMNFPPSLSVFDRLFYAMWNYKRGKAFLTPLTYLAAVKASFTYSTDCSIDGDTFYRRTAEKALVVTARFHALCFLVQSETPFFCLWSNSHKMQGMLTDIGLNPNLYHIDPENVEREYITMKLKDKDLFGSLWTNKIRTYKANANNALEQMCKTIFA